MKEGSVLHLRDVALSRGSRQILERVTFEVRRGELVAILGPSGAGKTTILRAVAGLESFHRGQIDVDGVSLRGNVAPSTTTLRALRRKVGLVFQFHCLFEHLSALENVCLAPVHACRVPPRDADRRARELLKAFGVDDRADALPRALSGGEAQRVAIARALAVDPPVLLLDEPTASLDQPRRTELGGLLSSLLKEGRALVIATHDEDFALAWATRALRLSDGLLDEGERSG
jgi:polar amino acid transport system ATP-binding protein